MQLKLTFEKLMNGDSDIAKYYKNANDLWEKFGITLKAKM